MHYKVIIPTKNLYIKNIILKFLNMKRYQVILNNVHGYGISVNLLYYVMGTLALRIDSFL